MAELTDEQRRLLEQQGKLSPEDLQSRLNAPQHRGDGQSELEAILLQIRRPELKSEARWNLGLMVCELLLSQLHGKADEALLDEIEQRIDNIPAPTVWTKSNLDHQNRLVLQFSVSTSATPSPTAGEGEQLIEIDFAMPLLADAKERAYAKQFRLLFPLLARLIKLAETTKGDDGETLLPWKRKMPEFEMEQEYLDEVSGGA